MVQKYFFGLVLSCYDVGEPKMCHKIFLNFFENFRNFLNFERVAETEDINRFEKKIASCL